MAFDVNNLVINRPLRGIAFASDGNILWTIDQIKEPTLTMSTEQVQAMDALDTPIMEFDRSKNCEFSATQAVFDLALIAAQSGTAKEYASETSTIRTPMWETVAVKRGETQITLKREPIAEADDNSIPFIWELKNDQSLSTRYEYTDGDASATTFSVDGSTLTLPTGATSDRVYLIPYEYIADGTNNSGAVKVTNSANLFNTASKFVLQCLGHNVCNVDVEYAIWLVFDNAKLVSDFDLTLSPEMSQAFTMRIMPGYCAIDKPLFSIIVPENPAN